MKTLIFFISILIGVNSFGQQKRDSIVVNDSWKKRDTIEQKKSTTPPKATDSKIKILKEKNTPDDQPDQDTFIEIQEQNNRDIIVHENGSLIPDITILGKNVYKRSSPLQKKGKNYRAFSGHWCGFQYGFVNFGNTNYSMYPGGSDELMSLDWSRSFAMQFNVFEHSINLVPSNNFGLVVGLGLEYQRLMFENRKTSVTLTDEGVIIPKPLLYASIKRNSFKNLFLTIPLLMEFQFPAQNRKRLYISAGAVGGLRMHSKTKVVYHNEAGKKRKSKNKDNFNQIPFKADVLAKIGYRSMNVWGSYTLTRMFKEGRGPELHPYTIGVGLSF